MRVRIEDPVDDVRQDEPDVIAGAALWACVSFLRGRGLITAEDGTTYVLTQAGRDRLAAR